MDKNQLCDQLAIAAGIDKTEYLTQRERQVTHEELAQLAAAYESKIAEYNWYFNSNILHPTRSRNYKKVWTTTLGENWGLHLYRRVRNGKPTYFIHLGVK